AADASAPGASARGLHDLTQARQKAVVFGRLVEKGIGAGERALHLIFGIGEVRQHEYLRLRRRFIGPNVANDGDSVAFLQPDVGNDDIRMELLDRLDRLLFGLGKPTTSNPPIAWTLSMIRLRISAESSTTKTRSNA